LPTARAASNRARVAMEQSDNKTVRELRATIRRLESRVEKEKYERLQAEADTKRVAKFAVVDVIGAFKKQGLPAEAGVLYLQATHLDDISNESIANFISEFGDAWRKPPVVAEVDEVDQLAQPR
jgi:DNA primase large subunit